jgi:hypothetical protein
MSPVETLDTARVKTAGEFRAIAYVLGAFLIGAFAATAHGFVTGRADWFGAACVGPLLGLGIGAVRRSYRPTSLPQWMFWFSILALVHASMADSVAILE